jgi:GT2 family glycosyltransferase
MPRVERNAEVTLVVLVYRSLRWLDWCMEGVDSIRTDTRYRWLVVANDATEEVRADPRISVDFRNDDPGEFYINRVYRAWNEGVLNAPTPWVVMLNSDMFGSDGWIDELMDVKCKTPKLVPTSLLIESGRLPSGMPEYVRDFGKNPDEFKADEFKAHAASIAKPAIRQEGMGAMGVGTLVFPQTEPGRLYMPILVDRQEFMDVGGYPEGNPPGTTGDKDLVRRYAEAGFTHVTALGSVVYHCQIGEQTWP